MPDQSPSSIDDIKRNDLILEIRSHLKEQGYQGPFFIYTLTADPKRIPRKGVYVTGKAVKVGYEGDEQESLVFIPKYVGRGGVDGDKQTLAERLLRSHPHFGQDHLHVQFKGFDTDDEVKAEELRLYRLGVTGDFRYWINQNEPSL